MPPPLASCHAPAALPAASPAAPRVELPAATAAALTSQLSGLSQEQLHLLTTLMMPGGSALSPVHSFITATSKKCALVPHLWPCQMWSVRFWGSAPWGLMELLLGDYVVWETAAAE